MLAGMGYTTGKPFGLFGWTVNIATMPLAYGIAALATSTLGLSNLAQTAVGALGTIGSTIGNAVGAVGNMIGGAVGAVRDAIGGLFGGDNDNDNDQGGGAIGGTGEKNAPGQRGM